MDEKGVNHIDEAAGELTEAARESYRVAVDRAFTARESNTRLARNFFEDWVDTLEAHAELNRRTGKRVAELAWQQREALRQLSLESLVTHENFVDSLFSYYKEVSKEPKKGD
jgi:hypothetical protein